MKLTIKNLVAAVLISSLALTACKKDIKEIGTPGSKVEGIKANWEAIQVVQVDELSLTKESISIYPFFKESKLPNISFADSTFTVDTAGLAYNYFGGPAGKWKFDDVEYPSKITFTPDGGSAFDLKLDGPIRPQDNLRLSVAYNTLCGGKETHVMSYNIEFTRK